MHQVVDAWDQLWARARAAGANFGSVAVQGSETVAETYLSALHGPTKHGLAETAEMLLEMLLQTLLGTAERNAKEMGPVWAAEMMEMAVRMIVGMAENGATFRMANPSCLPRKWRCTSGSPTCDKWPPS